MVMLSVLNNPLQLGIMGKLLGLMGRIVKGCVREVSLAQVSCILMYVYVALPIPVDAWSMALGLWQRFEYYYYYVHKYAPIIMYGGEDEEFWFLWENRHFLFKPFSMHEFLGQWCILMS